MTQHGQVEVAKTEQAVPASLSAVIPRLQRTLHVGIEQGTGRGIAVEMIKPLGNRLPESGLRPDSFHQVAGSSADTQSPS